MSRWRSEHLRLLVIGSAPFLLIGAGALGYRVIEGWAWFDALYMAVITLTTIGFGEVHPLGVSGRAFTMVLALGGIFTLFFTTAEVLRLIVSGEVQRLFGKRRAERKMAELKEHVIVCGFGRMGRQICQDFEHAQTRFVAIDKNEACREGFDFLHGQLLIGDASSDDILRQAGIDRARAFVVAVATDADNVFITMSARLLNASVPIIARAEEGTAVTKLTRAGASRVVSPYVIGGGRVAQAVLRPAVLDFIEVATRSEHLDLQIEEIQLRPGSAFDGATLHDSDLRGRHGLIVVAVKQRTGHMIFNPPDELRLAGGDTVIALGRREQLERANAQGGA